MKSHVRWQSCHAKTENSGPEVHETIPLLRNSWNYLHLDWRNTEKILSCHFSWISRSRKHVKSNTVLNGLSWFWLHQNWHPAVGRCLYLHHQFPHWQFLWELGTKATTLRPLKVSQFLTCVDAVFEDLMLQSLSDVNHLKSACSTHRIGLLM